MRITKLYIKQYKNLKEFTWEINADSPIVVIVGKNASGKTNLLNALIHIFGQCYAYTQGKLPKSIFDFSITYETNFQGKNLPITFKHENSKYSFYQNDDITRAIRDKNALPEKIFTYYSGESKLFSNTIEQYNAYELITYLFPQDNHFILLSVFSSRLSTIKENILHQQFQIKEFLSFTLTIQNPHNKISNKADKPGIHNFWGAPDHLKKFYEQLVSVCSTKRGKQVFRNGKLTLTIGKDGLDTIMEDLYEYDLYNLLQQSAGYGFIRQIDNFSFLKEGVTTPIGFDDLSEGERQRIGLLGAFAVYQGKETLFLLDEPDAFAHPRWQWDFVPDIQAAIGDTHFQQVILATHSPIVVSTLTEPAFMMNGGKISKMNSTFGYSVDETLAEQDVPWRKGEVANTLKKYLALIQDGKAQSEEAKALRKSLESSLGKNHQELKGADDLISLYE